MGRLELDVSYAARRPWVPSHGQLSAWAAAALTSMRRPATLSVRVVGDARSRSLNAHYRRKDRPTNVLSFAGAGIAPNGRNFLGELVICAPVVAEEARTQGKTIESHWAHMTVHGVLHLVGFDHERAAEARKMAAREAQILDRLGFSDPYR
ncbi:MAG TPA: rRNA maturation RNase YbeY [Steroidobacteraceae bacterium]